MSSFRRWTTIVAATPPTKSTKRLPTSRFWHSTKHSANHCADRGKAPARHPGESRNDAGPAAFAIAGFDKITRRIQDSRCRPPPRDESPDDKNDDGSDDCANEPGAFAGPVPTDRLAEISSNDRPD